MDYSKIINSQISRHGYQNQRISKMYTNYLYRQYMYIHKYIPIMYVDIILVQKEIYLGLSP